MANTTRNELLDFEDKLKQVLLHSVSIPQTLGISSIIQLSFRVSRQFRFGIDSFTQEGVASGRVLSKGMLVLNRKTVRYQSGTHTLSTCPLQN